MITTSAWERRDLFRNDRWAELLMDTLNHYRGKAYLLHEFVIMPDHLHAIITPTTSLEKAVQFVKGGFSYRAKKELGSNMEVWQKGFSDHRIRDASDYRLHVTYVRQNPVRKHLCKAAQQYEYSSASGGFELDGVPQGLKPLEVAAAVGAAKAAPFQSKALAQNVARFQNGSGSQNGKPHQTASLSQDEAKIRDGFHSANNQRPRTND